MFDGFPMHFLHSVDDSKISRNYIKNVRVTYLDYFQDEIQFTSLVDSHLKDGIITFILDLGENGFYTTVVNFSQVRKIEIDFKVTNDV